MSEKQRRGHDNLTLVLQWSEWIALARRHTQQRERKMHSLQDIISKRTREAVCFCVRLRQGTAHQRRVNEHARIR